MKRIPSVGLSNLQRIIRAVDTTDVNTWDSVNKNRRHKPKGMLHPRAKLSDDDVIKMRALLKTGRRQKDISIMFGISRQTVTHINRRITWPHIP